MCPADRRHSLNIYSLSISISSPASISSRANTTILTMSISNTIVPAINAVNKTKYRDIPLITSINYNSWQRTVLRVLQEIDADGMISGDEDGAHPLDVVEDRRMNCYHRPEASYLLYRLEVSLVTSEECCIVATTYALLQPPPPQKGFPAC